MIDSCMHCLEFIANYEEEYVFAQSSWYFWRSNVTEEGDDDNDKGGIVSWSGIWCLLIGHLFPNYQLTNARFLIIITTSLFKEKCIKVYSKLEIN